MTKEEKIRMFSAFLPYDLKVCTSYGSPKLNNPKLMCGADIDRVKRNKSESFIMKPILYDLSYLTQEIEHKGERFVPLIELYPEKITLFNARKRNAKIECRTIQTAHEEFDYSLFIDDKMVFKYATYRGQQVGSFFLKGLFITSVYGRYEKLLEWHFNIFQLPEDQFINKATLTNK